MPTLRKIIFFRITTNMSYGSKDNKGNRDSQVRIKITENKTKYF